jgi:predicted MFS family arabinose efflux permease
LRAGFLSSAAVFLFYSLIKSAVNIFPVQILLAFSWSTLYVGSLIYLLQRNEEKATATGLLGASISASMVLGPLLGGCALSFMDFSTLFKLASLLSLFCTLFSLRL